MGLSLVLSLPMWATTETAVCAGSTTVSRFRLYANPGHSDTWRPIRHVNALSKDARLRYQPAQDGSASKDSEVALVVVPPSGTGPESEIQVLDPKRADQPQEWKTPAEVRVLAVVYGPDGLDRGRVRKLVKEDRALVAQLAEYAEQTALVESAMRELSAGRSGGSLEAALAGLSTGARGASLQYSRTAPLDQQMVTLMRGLNPALSGFDPLVADSGARTAQTVGLAATVAGLFFGNSVGLAASSALLFQNLRQVMFPGTEFRSSFAQINDTATLNLCAKHQKQAPRTRVAYLWATRLPNDPAPQIQFGNRQQNLLSGAEVGTPVLLSNGTKWTTLERLDNWRLVNPGGSTVIPVETDPDQKGGVLHIKVPEVEVPDGPYRLLADQDWKTVAATGEVAVLEKGRIRGAELPVESSDRLVTGAGPVDIELRGNDFEFIEKVQIHASGEPAERARPLAFALPNGQGAGEQPSIRVTVPAGELAPGAYDLLLTETGGTTETVPLRLLPPHPKLTGLPLLINLGETAQPVDLAGTGLERIKSLSAPGLTTVQWTADDGRPRWLVRPSDELKRGQRLTLAMKVEGVSAPVPIDEAVLVMGPRPAIQGLQVSLPADLGVGLQEGEVPADSTVTFLARGVHFGGSPQVEIGCEEDGRGLATLTLRSGEQSPAGKVESAGRDSLFLALTPATVGQPGCTLSARVRTADGVSDPHTLGRIVRLPRIEKLTVTDRALGDGSYEAELEGYNLETIEQTGWETGGVPVITLPKGIHGQGQRQSLTIAVPWPSPHPRAHLHIWLRGEAGGRQTGVTY